MLASYEWKTAGAAATTTINNTNKNYITLKE